MKLIKEKDGVRGLVPARENGSADRAYSTYLNQLNPRDNEDLQFALADSNDPRFQEFLDRVTSPRYNAVNLATIAKACAIDLAEFNRFWTKASAQRAIAIAQTRSVKITKDMADDAESKRVTCPRCDGLTWIAAMPGLPGNTPGYRELAEGKYIRDCPDCTNGKITRPGDAHARDKILDMSGVLPKGKGISIIQNFGGVSHASAVSDLDDAMTIDIGE